LWNYLFENKLDHLINWVKHQESTKNTKKKKALILPKNKMTEKQKLEQSERQKSAYVWEFKKAKHDSNKIKDWLTFKLGIDWLNEYYMKDLPIEIKGTDGDIKIGYKNMLCPWENNDEIILFVIEDTRSNHGGIEDAEIIE